MGKMVVVMFVIFLLLASCGTLRGNAPVERNTYKNKGVVRYEDSSGNFSRQWDTALKVWAVEF